MRGENGAFGVGVGGVILVGREHGARMNQSESGRLSVRQSVIQTGSYREEHTKQAASSPRHPLTGQLY